MRSEGRNSNGFQLTNDAGEGNFEKNSNLPLNILSFTSECIFTRTDFGISSIRKFFYSML